MEKEKYFTEEGKQFAEKVVKLASEIEPKERDRFIDFMEGAVFVLRNKKLIQKD